MWLMELKAGCAPDDFICKCFPGDVEGVEKDNSKMKYRAVSVCVIIGPVRPNTRLPLSRASGQGP